MTSPRPQYVSPSLRPTSPWAQQTSTGTFRPPPPFSLQDSRPKKSETPKQGTDLQSRGWEHSDDTRVVLPGTMEQIVEMIAREMRLERETLEGHQTKNRDLDRALRREQEERKTLQFRADTLQMEVRSICEHLQLQKCVIEDIVKSLQ